MKEFKNKTDNCVFLNQKQPRHLGDGVGSIPILVNVPSNIVLVLAVGATLVIIMTVSGNHYCVLLESFSHHYDRRNIQIVRLM